MKKLVRAIVPYGFRRMVHRFDQFLDPYPVRSYSQEGEDLILQRLLCGQKQGFYVDVGAHHPMRFSNTCLLYQAGWTGINIDPNPESIRLFEKMRKRDTNVQIGISDQQRELKYFQFSDPALNTFDEALAHERQAMPDYSLEQVEIVQVDRLDHVLGQHVSPQQTIDLFTIDAEGFDGQVVKSNDWNKFRPRFVLVESSRCTVQQLSSNDIHDFMGRVGYDLIAKTANTLFYRDKSSTP